jgi:hypothetical protein
MLQRNGAFTQEHAASGILNISQICGDVPYSRAFGSFSHTASSPILGTTIVKIRVKSLKQSTIVLKLVALFVIRFRVRKNQFKREKGAIACSLKKSNS